MTDRKRGPIGGLAFDTMAEAYPALRDIILAEGRPVAPRGEPTIEVLGASFTIEDAVMGGVPVGTGRKVGVKMQAIDGTGNLAGMAYPDVARSLAPVMDRFMDDMDFSDPDVTPGIRARANAFHGDRFQQGAYGPRLGEQLERAERQLRRDPDTRQAVVVLWREEDANPKWRDRPCTTEFQLMVREGRLDIHVTMRANDLWTGTCYDVFQFGQIQAAMANVLGVEPGRYHHHATSLHIYDRDVEKFERVVEGPVENERESAGPDWASLAPGSYSSWPEVRERFRDLLEGARDSHAGKPWSERGVNAVEDWYEAVLIEGRAPA